MSKIDHSLFDGPAHDFGTCPECENSLQIRNGKTGPFIGCSAYPNCTFSKPLHDNQTTTLKEMPDVVCPSCGSAMAIKNGRYGMFLGCTDFPDCHYIEPISTQEDTQLACPTCKKGHIVERTNKYGKRFFACNNYPSCRYVVNFTPLPGTCPECGWELLVKKKGNICCPQPTCDFKQTD